LRFSENVKDLNNNFLEIMFELVKKCKALKNLTLGSLVESELEIPKEIVEKQI